MATITDILISELDPAVLPAKGTDELVVNQYDDAIKDFVTRRINWSGVGDSIQDLSGDINFPGVKQILFADGTETEPSITFKSDTSTGIYKPLSPLGTVAITSDGGEVMRATTQGIKKLIGIGFTLNQMPEDSLHVKGGGTVFEFGNNNKLHFKSRQGLPSIDTVTDTPMLFATNGIERGRFTEGGNFEFYGALGVGTYVGGTPVADHGDDGYLLLSQGDDVNPIWSSPYEFLNDNVDIITNILITDPNFIEQISNSIDIGVINEKLDDLNIGDGLAIGARPDAGNQPEKFLYNTFIFSNLPTL